VDDLTVVAVDWSGREAADQINAIRAAAVFPDGTVDVWFDLRREDVIEELVALDAGRVVVGFDFSFGFPEWVGRLHGCTSAPEMWPIVARHAEEWIAQCPDPFYAKNGKKCGLASGLLRNTERALRAKSTFQLAGAGHVGTGSLRGMPLLRRLRDGGFDIWPFDSASARTAVEIYPSALRARSTALPVPSHLLRAVRNNENTRDAVQSAAVMWAHRDALANLRATDDPTVRLEGQIWVPEDVEVVTRAGVAADDAR